VPTKICVFLKFRFVGDETRQSPPSLPPSFECANASRNLFLSQEYIYTFHKCIHAVQNTYTKKRDRVELVFLIQKFPYPEVPRIVSELFEQAIINFRGFPPSLQENHPPPPSSIFPYNF
jgi:hypothetical protein